MPSAIRASVTELIERGENADAVEAEGHAARGRPARHPHGIPTEPQRRGIGEVVGRIRQQGQAASEIAGECLDGDECQRQPHGPTQPGFRDRMLVSMTVAMGVSHRRRGYAGARLATSSIDV